jgi:hypothetical protein
VAGAGFAVRGRDQLVQDAAFVRRMVGVAAVAQLRQLAFERAQALQPGPHPLQLRFDQGLGIAAVVARAVDEIEQVLHFRQRHVERPAVAHEGQPLQLGRAVAPVAVGLARRRRQQAGLFVIADGVHVDAGGTAQVADLHALTLAA